MRSTPSRTARGTRVFLLAALVTAPACIAAGIPIDQQARDRGLESLDVMALTGRVHAWRGGTVGGPRLLFVHGTPGEGAEWADFLAAAPPGWEAVAPDRPGFGASGPREAVPELAAQAEALEPFLTVRDGVGTVLVGHSLGAPIAAWAAARYPDKVAALVLIAGSMDPTEERLHWYNRLVEGLPFLFPTVLVHANDEILPLEGQLEALERLLPSIRCPVWIVHGRADDLVPFANAEWTRARLTGSPSVRTTVFPGAGHLLIWEEPFASRLRAILVELCGSLYRPETAVEPGP